MLDVAKYSAIEFLSDGRRVEIRALRPEDQIDLLAAIDRASAQSRYRRLFRELRSGMSSATDWSERPFTGTPIKLSNTDQVASAIT